MQFGQWAHRWLLWAGVIVVAVIGVYAGFQGWLEWAWPGLQALLVAMSQQLLDRFPHFETLDRWARIAGALGTAATAAFGVYSGLYYAKRSLPKRLREMLAAADGRLLQDRGPLLDAISERRSNVAAEQSVFHVDPLNRALSDIGFGKLDAADGSLQEALAQNPRTTQNL
jgi:hypothetical protein